MKCWSYAEVFFFIFKLEDIWTQLSQSQRQWDWTCHLLFYLEILYTKKSFKTNYSWNKKKQFLTDFHLHLKSWQCSVRLLHLFITKLKLHTSVSLSQLCSCIIHLSSRLILCLILFLQHLWLIWMFWAVYFDFCFHFHFQKYHSCEKSVSQIREIVETETDKY